MQGIKSVQFGEKLHQGSLNFSVAAGGPVQSLCSNGVDLVQENHTGSFFFCEGKEFAHHAAALANVFLGQFTADHSNEGGIGVIGHCFCKQRFSTSGWTDEQNTFWRDDAHFFEQFWLHQRQFNRFSDRFDLFVQSCNVFVGDRWFLNHFSTAHHWVPRLREDFNHRQAVLIQRHPRARFECIGVQTLVQRNLEHRTV